MPLARAFVVACILLAATGCRKASTWEALPLGTSADFRAISFTDADHGWIAGGGYNIVGGLIGRTADGGKTWRFTSNLTSREGMTVSAFHMFDAVRGLVATGTGAILATTDGGENWTPVGGRGRVSSLSTLFFLDDRRGWAAGHGDVVRTDDGGETWTSLTPDNVDTSYRSQIRASQFLDDRRGWLAGNEASLLRTADGGVTWEPAFAEPLRRASPVATPLAAGARPHFWDIFFADDQTGWVVGEEGTILATRDGGTTWTRQSTGLKDAKSAAKLERIPMARGSVVIDAGDRTPGFTISAVRFVDPSRGWIAGFYAGLGRSLILRTEDAGATWVVDTEIDGEELRTLFVQGRERLWAIGSRVREGPQSIYRRMLTK